MAYTSIIFENPRTGAIKEAPVGFSWTVFFFGPLPPLFRGDWKFAILLFIIALFTFGLSNLVFMFIYNGLYIKGLIGDGFKAKSIGSGNFDEASTKVGIQIPILEES